MRQGRTWIVIAVTAGLTLAGARFTSVQAQAPKPAPAVVHQIVIAKVAFEDAPAKIKVGDTIEWINQDIVDHTATERNKLWDVTIAAGKKARVVMKKAGQFEYFCKLHPNMVSTVRIAK